MENSMFKVQVDKSVRLPLADLSSLRFLIRVMLVLLIFVLRLISLFLKMSDSERSKFYCFKC